MRIPCQCTRHRRWQGNRRQTPLPKAFAGIAATRADTPAGVRFGHMMRLD
jgi:hypothetical protein